jgi:hypothetical protein
MQAVALADAEDGDDIRVVQPRRGPGFEAEPLEMGPIRRARGPEYLERHMAAEGLLHGLIDDAHAAPADLVEDPIIAEPARGGDLAGGGSTRLPRSRRGQQLADPAGRIGEERRVLRRVRPLAEATAGV